MSISLHRIEISGKIDSNTPICVIYEIAQCLGFDIDVEQTDSYYVSKVIRSIPEVKSNHIRKTSHESGKFSMKELSSIAQFVNPDESIRWSTSNLKKAYKHIYSLNDVVEMPPVDFKIGQKDMDNLYAYNACMLYRVCIYYGIQTSRSMSMEDMGEMITKCHLGRDNLERNIINAVRRLPLVDLVSIISSPIFKNSVDKRNVKLNVYDEVKDLEVINPELEDVKCQINMEDLLSTYKLLNNTRYLMNRFKIKTHEEAIIMAAIFYEINLTEAKNPYEQYLHLKRTTGSVYIPVNDPEFKERYISNPDWFNLQKTWSPYFGYLINKKQLDRFAYAEGYTEKDILNSDTLSLMHMSRVVPTFYISKHPNCKLTTTTIEMEDIKELHPQGFVSYGIHEGGNWNLFKISGLSNSFKVYKEYLNPSNTSEIISNISIRKLKNIAKDIVKQRNIPESLRFEYQDLINSMNLVDLYSHANNEKARCLANLYRINPQEIENCLIKLLHAAYYMRGWKVGNNKDFPITRDKTQFEHNLQSEVDINVTRSISEFEQAVSSSTPEIKDIFENLPLIGIKRCNRKISFRSKNTPEEGITVFGRIEIVKAGETPHSCIRMSSNYLAISAYYYMSACKMDLPFKIEDLHEIS